MSAIHRLLVLLTRPSTSGRPANGWRAPRGWTLGPLALGLSLVAGGAMAEELVIRDVRLFDGERVIEGATVVVRDGVIAAAGTEVDVPAGAQAVDGAGKTLFPGLIDAHTHSWGNALERALVFGVTTHIDMATAVPFARSMAEEQRSGQADDRADLISAGTLITAPGGHGTQFGMEIPTLTTAAAADGFVAERIAEGSRFIKLVIEDGSLYGRELPTLDGSIVEAVIRAAHERDKLAVTHVSTMAGAEMALNAGTDGLVHLFGDRAATPELAAKMAEAGAFVIPTFAVLESVSGQAPGQALIDDERWVSYVTGQEKQGLLTSFPPTEGVLDRALESARRMLAAGVTVLAGSDAPNPGTTFGMSLHRELEILVRAGMSPVDALRAATSGPADAFGLADRGRIRPGLRADLVLVEGDPTRDIQATRAIAGIWKGGVAFERPLAPEQRPKSGPAAAAPGLISSFDGEGIESSLGWGWMESTDQMMGGKSEVSYALAEGGADGTSGALAIRGEIKEGFPYPWAGAMLFPGERQMAPADLSGAEGVRFWAKGDGGTYRVLFFAESRGTFPVELKFEVGDDWREIRLPFGDFPGLDPAGITGMCICAGDRKGAFELLVDQITFE